MQSVMAKPKQSIQRWKLVYGALLIVNLGISFVFQFGNIGWFIIILGLVYVVAFGLHLLYWGLTILRGKQATVGMHIMFGVNNLLFLLGNVLNVDFGDVSSYMFFMQYQNPPDFLVAIGVGAYVSWAVTLLLHGVVRGVRALIRKSAVESQVVG